MRLVVFFEFVSMTFMVMKFVVETVPVHQCPWAAVLAAWVPEPEVDAATVHAWARDEAVKACIGATSVRFIGLSSRVSWCPAGVSRRRSQ